MSEEIVARGRIRVDAKRAIRKLRDHLLVDLELYACEIARVAVATGATWLDVTWDTDDVRFTFDGHSLPAAEVARARDHVLSPDPHAVNGAALRVLGIGVSAALGMKPRFVDVITMETAGTTRVRFESKHLDEDANADEPALQSASPIAALAGRTGMQVHVRRKIAWADVTRALRRNLPREVSLLLEATRDVPLVLTLEGKPPTRAPEPLVLMRVDLDEPALRRGSLELLAAPPDTGHTQFLDQGVRLAETRLLGVRESADLPLRVVVDSARLPTNASRSQVQLESDVVQRVRVRMRSTFDVAIRELANVVQSGKVPDAPLTGAALGGHTVTFVEKRLPVLANLLGELAASVALAMLRKEGEPSEVERMLLSLPLLLDALGRPLALKDLQGEHVWVHQGSEALTPELESWMKGVVWKRGLTAERALLGHFTENAAPRVALARVAAERRARALAHEPSPARLPKSGTYIERRAFAIEDGRFAGLIGEVGVLRDRNRSASVVRVLIEDRLIEEMPLPGAALPVEMVLSWPRRLLPRFAYDGVERNTDFTNAMLFALNLAAGALVGGSDDVTLMRQAIVALVATGGALSTPTDASMLETLERARVWPLTDGKLATLAELRAYATTRFALCTGPAGAGFAQDGRPVLVSDHAREVFALLPTNCQTQVPYQRVLSNGEPGVKNALVAQAHEAWLTVPIKRPNAVGFVGVGPARERTLHGGVLVRDRAVTFQHGPVLIAYEDRTAVPKPDFRGILYSEINDLRTTEEEDALLEAVIAVTMRGDHVPAIGCQYLTTARERLSRPKQSSPNPALEARHRRVIEACERLLPNVDVVAVPKIFETPAKVLAVEHLPPPPSKPKWEPRKISPVPPPAPQGLASAIATMLRSIAITSRHVTRVDEVNEGRPVRYDRPSRVVFVNRAHELVRGLEGDPQRVLLLCIAAISEINRELAQVTDAEERRILTDLLR